MIKGEQVTVLAYGQTYCGRVIDVKRLRVVVLFVTGRGRRVTKTYRPDDFGLRWHLTTADNLTRTLTAFGSLAEMADAKGGYRPTIYPKDAAHLALRACYDRYQRQRGDERRAYPPVKQ